MKIFLKDEIGMSEVSKHTKLIFVEDNNSDNWKGIEVGINQTVDKNKVYVTTWDILKIIPRASNVVLISQERE